MLPDTMTTVEMREPGKPEVLELGIRPLPAPAPSEILIKVTAAGVNGPDLVQRRGHYPPPKGASDLLGLEVSGHVAALGDNVTGWAVGDTICGLTNGGGYAEYVAVDASHCLPIPRRHGSYRCCGAVRNILYRLVQPCLLYTSPSPRDRTRSRMPSSA